MKTPPLLSSGILKALLGAAVTLGSARAQFVVPPPPQAVAPSPSAPQVKTGTSAASIDSVLGSGLPLLRRGPVSVRPHFLYRFVDGNGVQTSARQPASTSIQQVSPGVLVELGNKVHIDYTPTWSFYSNSLFEDTVDHYASAFGSTSFRNWTFGLAQRYASASPSLIETGGPTHVETYTTEANVGAKLGERTSVSATVSRNIRSADAFTNSREWSTTEWLEYRFTPRVSASVGFAYGFTEISASPDVSFTRPQVRLQWKPTDRLGVFLEGGVERREFSGDVGALNSPVYDCRVAYSPFRYTQISVGASRKQTDSYFANQATKSEGGSVSIDQRVFGRFYLSSSLHENRTTFIDVAPGFSAGRVDRNTLVGFRLSTVILQQGTVGVTYQTGRNSSNDNAYSFTTRQFGFEFGYRF